MKARFVGLLAFLALMFAVSRANAASHVRVILDTSGSMVHNDAPHLAVLSTVLLYDLVYQNLSLGDTFAVMPFERTMPSWGSGPPPSTAGAWIRAERDKRAEFVSAVTAVEYNAPHTYYYPFLLSAIADLKEKGTRDDRRVIVLVTDGVPEDPDPGKIQRELVPELLRQNISLYILALGPQAASHSREIHEALGGTTVGDLFVDPDGRQIPGNMIEIFRRSFGYTGENVTAAAATESLDLERQQSPDQVAVVLYWQKGTPPEFNVRTDPDGPVNNPDGRRSASVGGGSYSLRWILAPRRGLHKLVAAVEGASAAILRPARLAIEIQPQHPGDQIFSAVANQPLPLRVLVRPSGANRGDPGAVQLSFLVHGPRQDAGTPPPRMRCASGSRDPAAEYAWDGDKLGAPDAGTGTADGRYFDIAPRFPCEPEPPLASYDGYITVKVSRGNTPVGSLEGSHAHHVLVYPYLQIRPDPPTDYAKVNGLQRALRRHEPGCASFRFNLAEGSLPHPSTPTYSLRAMLEPDSSGTRLPEAQYTLDGESLSYAAKPGLRPGNWFTGRRLSRKELVEDQHQLCVLVDKSRGVDISRPAGIGVRFTMIEHPYDSYTAINPFTLKMLIAPVNWTEKYAAWVALAFGALVLILQMWYQRFRPLVPAELRAAAGNASSPAEPLGQGSVVRRWLGLRIARPVLVDNGSFTLGWVRPINRELYHFRPASGVVVEDFESQDGGVTIAVNQTYCVKTKRGPYEFRLQYA